jgi:hypothetical protein
MFAECDESCSQFRTRTPPSRARGALGGSVDGFRNLVHALVPFAHRLVAVGEVHRQRKQD